MESGGVKYLSGSWVTYSGDISTLSTGSSTGDTWVGKKEPVLNRQALSGPLGELNCFFNSFIALKLLYTNLDILKIYSLESLGQCLHPWNHHHNQCMYPSSGFVSPASHPPAATKLLSIMTGSCGFSRIICRVLESLSIIIWKFGRVGVHACQYLALFYGWVIFHSIDTPHFSSIHSPVDGHVGLLQIKMYWTFVYTTLHKQMLPFISGKHLGEGWLGQMAGICLTFKVTVKMFSTVIV